MHVMSKSAIAGIVAAVFVVGLLLGLYVLPGLYAMQASKEAVQKAAPQVVSQAVQPLVKEQAQKTAKDIADTIAARPRDSDIDIRPAPKTDAAASIFIDRASFQVTLPPGSTLMPDNPKYGPDRLVECRLPSIASLNILLVDDKASAASIAESTLKGLRGTLTEPTTNHWSVLPWMNVAGVNGMEGSIQGQLFAFETGYIPGTAKACVIIIEYPMDSEKKSAATASIQQAISTLTVKQ
jgi:hypothetical protein